MEDQELNKQEDHELFEHYNFTADPGQNPIRIDKFLNDRITNVSRTKIQSAAEAGSILVNNKPVKSNYKVKPRDVISVVMEYPKKEFELIPEDIPLNIIYEDEDLLIVNKEAGMVVHPGFGHYTGTLVNALTYHLQQYPMFKNPDFRPGLVHRIDKDTSGLLVIAKNEIAKLKLAKQFFDHSIDRKYIALVWGSFENAEGTIEGNIGRNPKNRKIMHIFPDGEQGKQAITHYKIIEKFDYLSLLELKLETGRTHQIRAHMKYIGHPLFGDEDYGGTQILKGTTFTKYKQFVQNCFTLLNRQALHAKSLGFIHPKSGKPMFFDSEIPNDMQMVIEKWRNYIQYRKD